MKKEIQDAFQGSPRAKRLPRPSDGNDDEVSDVRDRFQQIDDLASN